VVECTLTKQDAEELAEASVRSSQATGAPSRDDEDWEVYGSGPSPFGIGFKELWRYRELLYFLTWRDVKVRYKQTVLGVIWAVLQPFMTMIVFSFFFGRLAGMSKGTDGVPYPVWVFAGLLPWTYFASALGSASSSLVGSTNLVTKVFFPRLVIPVASVGAGLVDFAVASSVLVGLMLYYKTGVSGQILLVPLFLIGTVLTATGVGSFLAALTVKYRDFRYVVPFMLQIWMFVTPVIYPPKLIPASARWILELNPMSGMIQGFRASFLGQPFEWTSIAISFAVAALLFLTGTTYFRRVERSFADII
jgi:lipopolysaccharide transport system permease protein